MSKAEKAPILLAPVCKEPSGQPISYGVVIHIDQKSQQTSNIWRSAWGGITSGPVLAFIGTVLVIALIYGISQLFFFGYYHGRSGMLRQSAAASVNHFDITTSQGKLRGYLKTSRQGREFVAFYKVPYASPPIGELRFKDTEPPKSWTGLRDNSEVPLQCIQKEKYPTPADSTYATGDEDCLYANIYVPNANSSESTMSYPVMLYIHGGGFSGNGSRYGAEYMMDEDIILVTFNYRIGPLGNLNTGDDVIRGNMGYKDMVQMLKWIQGNIKNFGGDPERVTIFGNSAGGMNVALLTLSPMAKELFQRAITQSGAAVCANAVGLARSRPENSVEIALKAYNCSGSSSEELLSCLREKSAEEIAIKLGAAPYILTVEDRPSPVEGTVFMPDNPYNLLKEGKSHPIPHIFGNVNAEGLGDVLPLLDDQELMNNLNQDFVKFGEEIVTVTGMSSEEMRSIKEFYFGDKNIGNETLMNLTNLAGDKMYVHCSYENARMHAKVGTSYLYWLSKPPAKSYAHKNHESFPIEEMGLVSHGDEIQFPYKGYPVIGVDDEKHFGFSRDFIKLWAHFAKTGETSMDGITWKKVDPDSSVDDVVWLELNDQTKETTEMMERMRFWNQFPHNKLRYV